MRCRETIFLDSSDIKTIIAQFFDTEECNVDIIVDNNQYGRRSNRTALSTVVDALEFGFACWGVIALVMTVIA